MEASMSTSTKRRITGDGSRAVAYLRVSTEDQRLGPEAQRAAIEQWAAREHVTIASWHTDAGVSGAADVDQRPGLVEALAALREANAGVLVVAKRDRLARDLYVTATIERSCKSSGARIVAADTGDTGDDPNAALMRGMHDLFAMHERSMIRARTKAALQAKKAKGERLGRPPFGFRVVGGALVADEAESAIVARVRELRAAGLTMRAIVIALADAGVLTPRGKKLALTQVANILASAA
jgi:DNA invertase Pin-like site-specific DNA recombinase